MINNYAIMAYRRNDHQQDIAVDKVLTHFIEIRQRALTILMLFIVFFMISFCLSNQIVQALATPLQQALGANRHLISTDITASIITPINLAADVAMLCTLPFVLFHVWRFIAPGLYRHEQRYLKQAIWLSMILFCAGIAFCFYCLLPFMFTFFVKALPTGVQMMPDMANALHLITRMLLIFGLCFQIPLINMTLVRLGWLELRVLREIRPYVIVAAFIIGMLLTPPDVFSQIMLALPLCLLYELGIFLASWKSL